MLFDRFFFRRGDWKIERSFTRIGLDFKGVVPTYKPLLLLPCCLSMARVRTSSLSDGLSIIICPLLGARPYLPERANPLLEPRFI